MASALQSYETAIAAASAALAAEAGNLVAAYAAYLGAANAALVQQQISQASAEQAFWQGVEQTRDAT